MRKILFLAALTLAACDNGGTDTTDTTDSDAVNTRADDIAALTGDISTGQAEYEGTCNTCHGDDGLGTSLGPDITAVAISATELATLILDGRNGMPAYGADANYTDQDIADIIAYVLSAPF